MYSIFKVAITEWRKRLLQAEPTQPLPRYTPHWWQCQPLTAPLPEMTFAVSAKAPLLDNYWTGSIFDLYSVHLSTTLRNAGVQCETFPATRIDRTTGTTLRAPFEVFHLLEQHPALDVEQSDVTLDVVRKLVVLPAKLQHNRPFFRMAELRDIVLIRNDLRATFEDMGITGCTYIAIEEYQTASLTS